MNLKIGALLVIFVFTLLSCEESNKVSFDVPTKRVKTCFSVGDQEYCVTGDFKKSLKENGEIELQEGIIGKSRPLTFINYYKDGDRVIRIHNKNKNYLKSPAIEKSRFTVYGYSPSPDTELPVHFMKVLQFKNKEFVLVVSSTSPQRLQEVFGQLASDKIE